LNKAAIAAVVWTVAVVASCLRGSWVSKPNPSDRRFPDG